MDLLVAAPGTDEPHPGADHDQLHHHGDLVLGADLTLVAASVRDFHLLYGESDQVGYRSLAVQRGESLVRDECFPVHSEDVPVSLPQPGDGLVVEVVHLALEEGRPAHLAGEHQVRRSVEERDVEAQELVEVLAGRQHEQESDENQLGLHEHVLSRSSVLVRSFLVRSMLVRSFLVRSVSLRSVLVKSVPEVRPILF